MELRARGEETVKVCALTGEGFEEPAAVKKHTAENNESRLEVEYAQ